MLPDLLGLAAAAAVLAVPFVSRRLRRRRGVQVPGAAVVPAPRPSPGGTAVPVVTAQPPGVMTGPYGYDNGLATGETS